jgi:thymidylate synthase
MDEQYLDLVREILGRGEMRPTRSGPALSHFGYRMVFDCMGDRLPLLTTKRMPWKTVLRELLWFISGKTSSRVLSEQGVRIWDANGSRDFLDGRGLTENAEGDLGPVYGFQWRHWGGEYDCENPSGGVDQLQNCIDLIKNDPTSRRIILSSWNVGDLERMALPPCHVLAQFYVRGGSLDLQLYQRSGDVGLGVPFNIASYGMLLHMVAHVCDLKAGRFIYILGDTHIYADHVDALLRQIEREPRGAPRVRITPRDGIDDFKVGDVAVEGYDPHPPLVMFMSA